MHSARALAKPEQLPLFLIALMRLTLLGFHRGFSNYLAIPVWRLPATIASRDEREGRG
jgi:hypothetical protein